MIILIIRLGYVAMTKNLKDCSPSNTVTAKTYNSLTEEGKKARLYKKAKQNLINTLRILRYNQAYNIHVYRLTSKLIPLATYPGADWDWEGELQDEFRQLGACVVENNFRISAHPDHFTVINTPNKEVFAKSMDDLIYHSKIFKAANLECKNYSLILHVGGLYTTKALSVKRFADNFSKLPCDIQKHIALENDDKSFCAKDVLAICSELKIPMVLDVHHERCTGGQTDARLLHAAFETWNGDIPKIHFSSPKSQKNLRSHADYIDEGDFISFLKIAKEVDLDFDIMLEAKEKDNALFDLTDKLKKSNFEIIDSSTIKL